MFFDSFAIRDTNLSNCSDWIGCDGAVRVKHSMYNGTITSRVVFCLSRAQQKKFPDFCAGLIGQQKMDSDPSASSGNQQNRFSGFNTPPVRREIPADMTF